MNAPRKISLSQLFLEFLKLGATGFGALAIIDYIQREICEKKKWLDTETFNYGIVVSQMIPGSPTTQVASYVGLHLRGIAGAIVSFIAYNLPSFALMILLSYLYQRVHTIPQVASIFSGLQAIILAIVLYAVFNFGKNFIKTTQELVISLIALVWLLLEIHPIIAIIFSGVLGLLVFKRSSVVPSVSGTPHSNYGYKSILLLFLALSSGFVLLFFVNRKLFELGASMLRVDLLAFGGGYAAIPIMFHEVVSRHQWLNAETFLNGIALGQVTPGPVIITSTFIGYLHSGFPGALIATISIYSPSLLILITAVPYFDRLKNNPYFNRAVRGMLCAFVGLLAWLALSLGLKIHWDWFKIVLAGASFIALLLKLEMVWIIIAGAIIITLSAFF